MRLLVIAVCVLATACQIRPVSLPPSPSDDRFDQRIEGLWRGPADEDMTLEIWRDESRYIIRYSPRRGAERRFRADLVRFEGGDFVVVEARGPSIGVLRFPLMLEATEDTLVIRPPREGAFERRLYEAGYADISVYCGEWGLREFCAPTLEAPAREVFALLQDAGPESYFEEGEAWERLE